MKLMFIGADHEVTGSCHYLEACGKNILVDCGMEQGSDAFENAPLPVSAAEIDYILLTHAHIDHSGLLPLMAAQGFKGQVFATSATCDLADIMLRDSAHIQTFEAEWRNRKAKRSDAIKEYEPLYTMEDAINAIRLLVPSPYGKRINIYTSPDETEGIDIRFTDVGHLLGSSAIEVWISETESYDDGTNDGEPETISKKIVFSGDVGNINQPLIKDPGTVEEADYVLIESTYGDRLHDTEREDYVTRLAEILQETFDKGGNVVIPSFAVGRTQELLYFLRQVRGKRLVKGHETFRVYVDSPLAVEATGIFNKNKIECFDEEAMALVNKGINPISFPGLTLSITSDESKEINFIEEPKVIISASGMCEAGRIRHHLKHNLWRPECTVLFVGYQANGTLGRALIEGAKEVKLFGETIEVRAKIMQLAGISGHADRKGLMDWLHGFKKRPSHVFVVHGEDSVCDIFAQGIKTEFGYDVSAPFSGSVYDLSRNMYVKEAAGVRVAP
ncbi:MAG: MBL fold metallo-hydrolase, partial [Lachnospiraceae bacterium]|nr:MBL fold metallo-hydrolase [Lachnospiraceae bacterium]